MGLIIDSIATTLPLPTKQPFTLKNIYLCLYSLRAHWQTIGVLLDIDNGTLASIKANDDTVEGRLREMITTWLSQDTSQTSVMLADAVKVIDPNIGRKIRETF